MKPLVHKNKLRIGDVAKQLEVKESVIRLWEREFRIKTKRSAGGQRFYTKKHLEILNSIRDLVYTQGHTISDAKQYLEQQKLTNGTPPTIPSEQTKLQVTAAKLDTSDTDTAKASGSSLFVQHLHLLRTQLLKLKDML